MARLTKRTEGATPTATTAMTTAQTIKQIKNKIKNIEVYDNETYFTIMLKKIFTTTKRKKDICGIVMSICNIETTIENRKIVEEHINKNMILSLTLNRLQIWGGNAINYGWN